jgi:hypothetical protein
MGQRILAGVTADTFNHLQLGPGAIIKDFDYEGITSPKAFKTAFLQAIEQGQSFGGTQGGINIEIVPTYRKIPIDGATVPFKGDSVIDEWTCQMSCTLKEFTPQVLKAAFPTAQLSTICSIDGGITSMKIQSALDGDSYDKNHTWIASTQYGYLMVAMKNALGGTTGPISAQDKAEGSIPFQSRGTVAHFLDIDFAPCEIWFVDMHGGVIQSAVVSQKAGE